MEALSNNTHGIAEATGSAVRLCPGRWAETDVSLDRRHSSLGPTNWVEHFVISRRENVKPLGELSQEHAIRLSPARRRWCSWEVEGLRRRGTPLTRGRQRQRGLRVGLRRWEKGKESLARPGSGGSRALAWLAVGCFGLAGNQAAGGGPLPQLRSNTATPRNARHFLTYCQPVPKEDAPSPSGPLHTPLL